MKIIILILLICLCACSSNEIEVARGNNSFILTNVNIIDVQNQTMIAKQNIVINRGKIDAILPQAAQLESPSLRHLKKIDGKGGYVTPGLIDMHVHMYEPAAYIFTLSHGVTHVRIMNGVPEQLLWRDNIQSGSQIGSTSSVSSPIISGYRDAYLHHSIFTPEEAKVAVRNYQKQGYDLIKAYGNLTPEVLSALIDEAKKTGIPIAKHGPHASGHMPITSLKGLQSLEHVEDIYQGPLQYQFAPRRLPSIAQALKNIAVPVTPTLNIYQQLTLLSQQKQAYLTNTSPRYTSDIIALEAKSNQVKRWLQASDKMTAHNERTLGFLLHITKAFHQQGVALLVGSDSGVLLSPHGLATHNEMQLLQQAGLSSFEVLAAATINPAKALKLDKRLGVIAVSYDADFIYSLSDPIADLSVLKHPEAVVKDGYWYSKQNLDDMREQAIASRSIWQELLLLFSAL